MSQASSQVEAAEAATPLATLLQWAKPLYEASSNFTLLQLIPIHQSLLQAGALRTVCEPMHGTNSSLPFRPWCVSDVEAELCAALLSDPTEDLGTHLLVVQYLFANISESDEGPKLWWTLWMYWEEKNEKFANTKDVKSLRPDAQEMDIFLRALIEVVLSSPRIVIDDPSEWTSAPKNSSSFIDSEWYWHRTTLLLVEWGQKTKSSKKNVKICQVLVSFFDKTLQSVWQKGSDEPWADATGWYQLPQSAGWKALTQVLLPAFVELLEDPSIPHELSILLWKTVWIFWTKTKVNPGDEPILMLVVTTLLCPIWPYLAKAERLPDVDQLAQGANPQPLSKHQGVWILLMDCLKQGLDTLIVLPRMDKNAFDAVTTLVRRRALFLLRTMVADRDDLIEWIQYVACFETLEMEEDKHLVAQVWPTVGDLMAKAASQDQSTSTPAIVSMEWLEILLGHALISADLPFLRKENLYRFFRGLTGVLVPDIEPPMINKKAIQGAPLSKLSFDFVWKIVIPAFDTIGQSGGMFVHWIVNGKTEKYDVSAAFDHFFLVCMKEVIRKHHDQRWVGPWMTSEIMMQLRAKTVTNVLKIFAACLDSLGEPANQFPIESKDVSTIASNFKSMFLTGRFVSIYRNSVLNSIATILAYTKTVGKSDPLSTVSMLGLFPYPKNLDEVVRNEGPHWMESDQLFAKLGRWIENLARENESWASTIPSTLASAFVDGMMTETEDTSGWTAGVKRTEENIISRSIVFLCILATNQGSSSTASQMLWPAISKGLSLVPSVLLCSSVENRRRVERAAVLLEHGCKLQILSGNGNGDLVVDRKTEQMMPPPPSIESFLSHAVSFLFLTVREMLSTSSGDDLVSGSIRVQSRALSAKFTGFLETLRTLHRAYPSSSAVSGSANDALGLGLEGIRNKSTLTDESIQYLTLVFAALCCGADKKSELESTCRTLLLMKFKIPQEGDESLKPMLSLFEYSRWGSLAMLLPGLLDSSEPKFFEEVLDVAVSTAEDCPAEALMPLFESSVVTTKYLVSPGAEQDANDTSVDTVLLDRLIGLLTRIMADLKKGENSLLMLDESSRLIFQRRLLLGEYRRLQSNNGAHTPCLQAFRKLVKSAGRRRPHIVRTVLSRIIPSWMASGEVEAGLLAIPYRGDLVELLMYKEERLEASTASHVVLTTTPDDTRARAPEPSHELSLVRSFVLAFLSGLPGSSEICKAVRENLVNYLIMTLLEKVKFGKASLPMAGSPEYCRSHRGWQALCILSRFVEADIAEQVCQGVFEAMEEQMHGQTRFFLEVFTIQCSRRHPYVFGKALCKNLIRPDLHLQMVSSLMIVTGHLVVGKYKKDFLPFTTDRQADSPISLDQLLAGSIPWLSSTQGFSRAIAQLLVHALIPMTIGVSKDSSDKGNWFLQSVSTFLEANSEMKRLRKKQTKFFDNMDADMYCTLDGCLSVAVDDVGEAIPKHMTEIIKAALADVYKEAHGDDAPTWKQVQEMVEEVELEEKFGPNTEEALVNFQRKIIPLDALNIALEEHREKRLRNLAGRRRQPLIVCASLVDKVPNLGGLARTSEIFAADRLVVPDKKIAKMDNFTSISVGAGDWIEIEECDEKVRFELHLIDCICVLRSRVIIVIIIPRSVLNLLKRLTRMMETNTSSLPSRSTLTYDDDSLLICFCHQNLLRWLRARKREGWFVLGIEQTSSSVSMCDFRFPNTPTILLLGKEKEGIPVEYLQAVDQCVEIPQLGIIRSLNVHVSGALAIWEFTRQRMRAESLTL
eukprot:scaffold2448_cov155-Amphora_coffeaeformis.AAC.10